MLDEQRLRAALLKAAADRHPRDAYGDQLRDVIAGRQTLRGLAATEGFADRIGDSLDTAMANYEQRGEQDIAEVRRAFDPDPPKDDTGAGR